MGRLELGPFRDGPFCMFINNSIYSIWILSLSNKGFCGGPETEFKPILSFWIIFFIVLLLIKLLNKYLWITFIIILVDNSVYHVKKVWARKA
jgi:hypothetical protein